VELFNAAKDLDRIVLYNPDWKHRAIQNAPAGSPSVKFNMPEDKAIPMLGFQVYFGDRMKSAALKQVIGADTLVIRARSSQSAATIQIGLIDVNAHFFATRVALGADFKTIKIPLNSLKPAAQLLLPRPYPGFQPLYAQPAASASFDVKLTEKVEVSFEQGLEISSIYFK
jgi:hypothetical protein